MDTKQMPQAAGDGFAAVLQKDIEIQRNKLNSFHHKDEINDSTEVRPIVPVIKIRDSVFAVKGDISIVGGLPKVGKTSICAFIIATALMENVPEDFDSLGIKTSFCEGRPVVYIDTEQPQAYTDKLRKQVLRLLGVNKQPENLGIVNLRKYDSATKLAEVKAMMDSYPNTHLWIIDGLADLIKDPNDTKESFGVIETFMMKSDQLNTTIVLHIHENPGTTGKLRGNLGSEAERKCGGAISLKKLKDQKGVHSIESKVIRGSADFDPIFYRYDVALNRPVTLDATQSAEISKSIDKQAVKHQKLVELARRCLLTSLKYGELVESIMAAAIDIEGKTIKKRTAETRVKDLFTNGIITLNGDYYGIADKYIPQP